MSLPAKRIESDLKVFRDEYYVVNGEKIPSARTIIRWGVELGISTEILEKRVDEKGVEVLVRARKKDGQYTDEWVRMEYITEAYRLFIQKLTSKLKSGNVRPEDVMIAGTVDSPWGKIPAFTDPALNFSFQEWLIRTFTYLPRIVVTKAKSRAILQLLGKEFREEFEVEQELSEVEDVQSTKRQATEKQLKKLYVLTKQYSEVVGKDLAEVKESIKQHYGVKHFSELDVRQASEAIDKLEKFLRGDEGEEDRGDSGENDDAVGAETGRSESGTDDVEEEFIM